MFSVWSRAAARLTGQVTERAVGGAAAGRQTAALEEVIRDEKQKNDVLERAILDLKQCLDDISGTHSEAQVASKRLLDSERERCEQMRIQLMKHVAISNTQNAELQKSRQMYSNLVEEQKKQSMLAHSADSTLKGLQQKFDVLVTSSEIERTAAAKRETVCQSEIERIQGDLDLSQQQFADSLANCSQLKEEVEAMRHTASEMQDKYDQLYSFSEIARTNAEKDKECIASLSAQMATLEARGQQEMIYTGNNEKALSEAKVTICTLQEELSRAEEFASEQKGSLEDLCSIVVDLKTALKKNHSRCKHLEQQRDGTRAEIGALVEQGKVHTAAMETNQHTVKKQFTTAMERLQGEIKRLSIRNDSLEAQLDGARRDEQSHKGTTDRDLATAQDRLQQLVARVQECEHVLRVKDKLLDDQASLISDLRNRIGLETKEAEQKVITRRF